jgi:hypothetical protein
MCYLAVYALRHLSVYTLNNQPFNSSSVATAKVDIITV